MKKLSKAAFAVFITVAFVFIGNFVFADSAPVISSISPSSAQKGDEVTIYGSNFGDAPYVEVVGEGWTVPVNSSTNSRLKFTVSSGFSLGEHTLRVSQRLGEVGANSVQFEVISPPESVPSISSIEPSSAEVGDMVKVYGDNFEQGSYVEFIGEGLTILPLSYSNNELSFRITSGVSLGAHSIRIGRKASDVKSNSVTLSVVVIPPPESQSVISSISPSTAKVGDIVTIYGNNFEQGSYVEFVGEGLTVLPLSYSNSSLSFRITSGVSTGQHALRIGRKASDVKSNSVNISVVDSTPVNPPDIDQDEDADIDSGEERVEQELDALEAAQDQLTQQQRNRITRLSELMIARLSAALDRIDGFIIRIESRLDKMDTLGLDTDQARNDLEDVRFLVEDGRSDVSQIPAQVDRLLESSTPQSSFGSLQGLVTRIIETNIRPAHSDLVAIIRDLKGIIEDR